MKSTPGYTHTHPYIYIYTVVFCFFYVITSIVSVILTKPNIMTPSFIKTTLSEVNVLYEMIIMADLKSFRLFLIIGFL